MEKNFNKKNKRLFEYQTSIQLEGQFLIQWIHPSLYNCLPNLKKDDILRDSPTSVDADMFWWHFSPNLFVIGSFPIWPGWSKWFESIQTIIWIAGIEITRKAHHETKMIFYRNNEIEFFQLFNSSDGLMHCHDTKSLLEAMGLTKC